MHFVQPVTAMFPGLVSSSLRPNQTSCESERSLLPRITQSLPGGGGAQFVRPAGLEGLIQQTPPL